jgi:Fur family ferric uptake transcriptional regulator
MTRQTPIRIAICSFFNENHGPADYVQILDYLKKQGLDANKTTIYRQLDFLLSEGLIRELDFGEGKKRYELKSGHHHHLLCTKCKHIECVDIEDNFQKEEEEILKRNNFKIKSHMLEFFGICGKCQEKGK